MKKILLLLIFVIGITQVYSQTASCCQLSTTKQNALLAMNDGFAKTHLEPLPFALENPKGQMIQFSTPDGKTANAYLVKTAKKSKKYLFVFHEWWGLNDYIKREADHWFDTLGEVNVLALDIYDGKVAATREEAQKYVGEVTQERLTVIIQGAFKYVGKSAKVATIGWCVGGSWSLQAAIIGENKVHACVMYYGFPEMNVDKLSHLNCDVLGIFAEKDQFINVKLVRAFEDLMKKAGKTITVYNYIADHAFANPSNPAYNPEATKDAFIKSVAYLKKNLKIKEKKK